MLKLSTAVAFKSIELELMFNKFVGNTIFTTGGVVSKIKLITLELAEVFVPSVAVIVRL